MPDLQTALKEALNEWEPTSTTASEKPMDKKKLPPQIFKPTSNVTRETFIYIQTHYGCTSSQVKDALVARGFKKNSVHSLITQLVNSKQVIRDKEGRLAAIVNEYMPMKSYRKTKANLTKKQKEMIMELASPPIAEVEEGTRLHRPERKADTTEHLTAQYVIDNIRVGEAKKLYQELIRIFQE
jgi:predicted transcriptional regulator